MRSIRTLILLLITTIYLSGCGTGKQNDLPVEKTYPFSLSEEATIIDCSGENMFALNSVIREGDTRKGAWVLEFDKHPERDDAKEFVQLVQSNPELIGWSNEYRYPISNSKCFETDDFFYLCMYYSLLTDVADLRKVEIDSEGIRYVIYETANKVMLECTEPDVYVGQEYGTNTTRQSWRFESQEWDEINTSFLPYDTGCDPWYPQTNGRDLEGMEIIIGDWWSDPNAEPTNDYEEAALDYMEWLEETYNCKITRKAISSREKIVEDYIAYVTSGGDANNYLWFLPNAPEVAQAIRDGLMYDVSAWDSYDEYQGNRFYDSFSHGDAVYSLIDGGCNYGVGVLFNIDGLEELGFSPELFSEYEYSKGGTWNWKTFEELLAKVHSSENRTEDQRELTANKDALLWAAVLSNNGSFFERDGQDYICKMDDPATLEALEWADSLYATYISPDALIDDTSYREAFLNGEALFLIDYVDCSAKGNWLYEAMSEKDFRVGAIYFPFGMNAPSKQNITYSENPLVVIPSCYDADTAEKIAFIWNQISSYGGAPGYECNASNSIAIHNGIIVKDAFYSGWGLCKNVPNYSLMMPDFDLSRQLFSKIDGTGGVKKKVENTVKEWQRTQP